MTNYMLPSHSGIHFESNRRRESQSVPGTVFWIRKTSLVQRIELVTRVRELTRKYEFLKAGDPTEQMEASLADLLTTRLYIEWGLERVEGLSIDGQDASVSLLLEKGPEELCAEIAHEVQKECGLSGEERKNS
jgi:hypothetical protein